MESTGPNPKLEELAEHLLAIEFRAADVSNSDILPGIAVTDKLRVSLSRLTGDNGYRSLMNRALSLAKAESSLAASLRSRQDGSVEGLDGIENELQHGVSKLVIVRFLSLLTTLIGKPLMLRLVIDVWPEAKSGSEECGSNGEVDNDG
jgi:hypothetical protein